jgi:hypothetical protein
MVVIAPGRCLAEQVRLRNTRLMTISEHIKRRFTLLPSTPADRPNALTVTDSGTVIVEVSSAARLLKENGTLDAMKKYMQPRYAKR